MRQKGAPDTFLDSTETGQVGKLAILALLQKARVAVTAFACLTRSSAAAPSWRHSDSIHLDP
jgi:hypothetical protein